LAKNVRIDVDFILVGESVPAAGRVVLLVASMSWRRHKDLNFIGDETIVVVSGCENTSDRECPVLRGTDTLTRVVFVASFDVVGECNSWVDNRRNQIVEDQRKDNLLRMISGSVASIKAR
jgi:hypothetical protein